MKIKFLIFFFCISSLADAQSNRQRLDDIEDKLDGLIFQQQLNEIDNMKIENERLRRQNEEFQRKNNIYSLPQNSCINSDCYSYKRKYFEDDFFTFTQENNYWNDDLMLAAYFSHKRRDRIATFHESDEKFNSLEEWSLRGGVSSFPVLRHTHHEHLEGCNLLRQAETVHGDDLYKYIDSGYIK
jgi:hypothetical protein